MGANAPGERKTENGERRTENGAPDKRATGEGAGRMWKVYPAGLTRSARRTTKIHEEETADFADWSRLGAGYRRQTARLIGNYRAGPKGQTFHG